MSGERSPSAFVELSTEHARKQLELLTEQAKELATLAQKGNACHRGAAQDGFEAVSPLKLTEDEPCGSANCEFPPPRGSGDLGASQTPYWFAPARLSVASPPAFAITDFAITDSLN